MLVAGIERYISSSLITVLYALQRTTLVFKKGPQKMTEKTRVEALPGKGFGLVANVDLAPGQVILQQPPLMLVDFKLNDEEVRDRDVICQRLTPLIEEQLQASIESSFFLSSS